MSQAYNYTEQTYNSPPPAPRPEQEKARKKGFQLELQEKAIEAIQNREAPWQKPFSESFQSRPVNPSSGVAYEGSNRINLTLSGSKDRRWQALWQINTNWPGADGKGGRIYPGSEGTAITFYDNKIKVREKDGYGNPVLDAKGKQVWNTIYLPKPILQEKYLFPATMIRDADQFMPPLEARPMPENGMERLRGMIEASGITVEQRKHPGPSFYNQFEDKIMMNAPEAYPSRDEYDKAVMYHLIESTRHPDRVERLTEQVYRQTGPRGTDNHTREQLTVKITAWMISDELGVQLGDPGDEKDVDLESQVKLLQKNSYEMMRIGKTAQLVFDQVMSLDLERERQQEKTQENELEQNGPQTVAVGIPLEAVKDLETLTPEQEFQLYLIQEGFGLEGREIVFDGKDQPLPGGGSYNGSKSGPDQAQATLHKADGMRLEWVATGVMLSEKAKEVQDKNRDKGQEQAQEKDKGQKKEKAKAKEKTEGRDRGLSR